MRTPWSTAVRISASEAELPLYSRRRGGNPAVRAIRISPGETTSAQAPAWRRRRRIQGLEFALVAKWMRRSSTAKARARVSKAPRMRAAS